MCPSEVARAMVAAASGETAVGGWRTTMPIVHTAVDQLVTEGLARLSWKGKVLKTRAGPYRIGYGERE